MEQEYLSSSNSTATMDSPAGEQILETGATVSDKPSAPAEKSVEKSSSEGKFDLSTYRGSKKVNPDQRPVKEFVREGMTQEKIDALIREAGPEIFLSDEEIAALDKKGEKKGDEAKPSDKKETSKEEKKGDEDPTELDPDEFFEKTGLDKETFSTLPEKTQEKLAEFFETHGKRNREFSEVQKKLDAAKTDIAELNKDPVFVARLEELRTGKAFVAKELPPVTAEELEKLDALFLQEDKTNAQKYLNDIIKARAAVAIQGERAVLDKKMFTEKTYDKSHEILRELGKIDKRLEITELDHRNINEGHKDFKTVTDILSFCKKHDITHVQVGKMGAEKLYKLIAADKGWDKERDKKIYNDGAQTFLQKLKNPTMARTLDQGDRSSSALAGHTQAVASREQLIDEISKGNYSNWDKAMEASDMNRRALAELGEIRRLGVMKGQKG